MEAGLFRVDGLVPSLCRGGAFEHARRLVAGTLALAFVSGLLVVVAGAAAPSRAVAQAAIGGRAALSAEESDAQAEAEATGEPVVVDSLTTPNQLVTAMPGVDGLTAEITALPSRVRREGKWLDVDESLQVDSESGRLMPAAAPVSFSVSADGDGPLVEMTSPAGESLSLSWPEEFPALPEPVLDGNLATFFGVLPDVDLVVGSYSGGFSTYLILHTAEAAALPEVSEFGFDMVTDGVKVSTDDQGRISAANDAGAVVFATHLPQQWDAGEPSPIETLSAEEQFAIERRKRAAEATQEVPDSKSELRGLIDGPPGARVSTMGLELIPADDSGASRSGSSVKSGSSGTWSGNGRLRLIPDRAMLTDPDTRFPAVLDPNFNQPDVMPEWAMVWSDGQEWWGAPAGVKPNVGFENYSSAPKKARSFYKFEIGALAGKQILSAKFLHRQIHSPEHACNTSGAGIQVWTVEAFGKGVSWPGPDKIDWQDNNFQARGHRDHCSTNIENEWNVKAGLESDLSHGYKRMRLGMYARDEKNGLSWRDYSDSGSIYPKLIVTYNRAPDEPSSRSVRNSSSEPGVWYDSKAWVRTHYPRLVATVSDPDGDTSRLRHVVKNSSGATVVTHDSYPYKPDTEVAWTIDKSLPDGTYSWTVSGKDEHGFEGPAWSPITIVVDTKKPAPPTVDAPKLASYGSGVKLKMYYPSSTAADLYKDVRQYKYGFLTSATPLSKSPTSLGGAVEVTRSGHMGPDWITATAADVAGNVSDPRVKKFKVMGASTSHQWRLDGNSADSAPSDAAALSLHGSPTYVAGHDQSYDPVGSGSVTWAANDKALSLNGSSQYATSSGESANLVNLHEGFSVSAWVKMDSADYGNWSLVAAFPDANDNWARARMGLYYDQWAFSLRTTPGGWVNVLSPELTLEQVTGGWVHLVAVYEPSPARIRLYVDGHEAGSVAVNEPVDQNENALTPLLLGASPNGASAPSAFFDGALDEVRVYSGPLDPTGAFLVSREVRNTSP